MTKSLSVYSHCTLDSISLHDGSFEHAGGSACYCGITAHNLGVDVNLYTKFGPDFKSTIFDNYNITLKDSTSTVNTTRFKLLINNYTRTLYVLNRCEPITSVCQDSDGILISPVLDEISPELLADVKKKSNFIFLDPQGFNRNVDSNNVVSYVNKIPDLSDITAVRVDSNFYNDITDTKPLQKKNVKFILFIDPQNISMLTGDRVYSMSFPNISVIDTTGAGDIFCSSFASTYLNEKDELWALCFAAGARQAALDSRKIGLDKIPKRKIIETNAVYFYNTIKFRHV